MMTHLRLTMSQLIKFGIHYGNPIPLATSKFFVIGQRANSALIDLDKSVTSLRKIYFLVNKLTKLHNSKFISNELVFDYAASFKYPSNYRDGYISNLRLFRKEVFQNTKKMRRAIINPFTFEKTNFTFAKRPVSRFKHFKRPLLAIFFNQSMNLEHIRETRRKRIISCTSSDTTDLVTYAHYSAIGNNKSEIALSYYSKLIK